MTVEPIESPERLGCISDIRPIKLKPSARVVRLRPVEIFWKCRDVFIVGIGWFFASGLRRLSADLTVRYRVQMILGYPVSEFAKKKTGACLEERAGVSGICRNSRLEGGALRMPYLATCARDAFRQGDRKPSERAHGRTLNFQRRILVLEAAKMELRLAMNERIQRA
jgi:hypothetical protein